MERYYYSCPIEAAYMIKHHGIKIDDHPWRNADDAGAKISIGMEEILDIAKETKVVETWFFVHPDSVKLLEPQENDLVDLGDHGFAIVVARDGNNIDCALFDASSGLLKTGYWHRRWHPIIQRNNKPFVMPKSEVV